MRAYVVTGPRQSAVVEVEPPVARPGQVVVDVARAGVCGTDVEFFTGEMAYLHQGHAAYPLRLGHEWCGTVSALGEGVDRAWLGRRVTGDTMLGCGRCRSCRRGRHHVCPDRHEIGIRGGWPGALAEQLPVPAVALRALPDAVDDVAGALVEPGGNAWRCVEAAGVADGDRLLVLGPGTIGLLVALLAAARGVQVHVAGREERGLDFARTLGVAEVRDVDDLGEGPYDAVVDATYGPEIPARTLALVQPAGRVVLIGLSGAPSLVDTRDVVLRDLTVVGVLGASAGLDGAVAAYASGAVDPRPLVAATVGLGGVHDLLSGRRPAGAGTGPKLHVDPRR